MNEPRFPSSGQTASGALLFVALCALNCGDADPDAGGGVTIPGGGDTSIQYRQRAELDGQYIGEIRIVGNGWQATRPSQQISLTFLAAGLSGVRQFELVLEPLPSSAFELTGASFAVGEPFTTFGSGVEVDEGNHVRIGGATFSEDVEGDHTLGTLRLATSESFNSLTRARITVLLLSLGPRSERRDIYEASELSLGVVVN